MTGGGGHLQMPRRSVHRIKSGANSAFAQLYDEHGRERCEPGQLPRRFYQYCNWESSCWSQEPETAQRQGLWMTRRKEHRRPAVLPSSLIRPQTPRQTIHCRCGLGTRFPPPAIILVPMSVLPIAQPRYFSFWRDAGAKRIAALTGVTWQNLQTAIVLLRSAWVAPKSGRSQIFGFCWFGRPKRWRSATEIQPRLPCGRDDCSGQGSQLCGAFGGGGVLLEGHEIVGWFQQIEFWVWMRLMLTFS